MKIQMKKFLTLFLFFVTVTLTAQESGSIEGMVLDNEINNEPLAFATVTVKGTDMRTTTDLDGIHRLKINPGKYTLVFNFPGYQKVEVPNIIVKEDKTTHIKDISLSALTLIISEDIGESNETSRSKR